MADRTSAEIFGMVFEKLASDPTDQHKTWARELWNQTREYDFSECQMCCDEALIALGLARIGRDERYGNENVVIYADTEAP